jgi:hypothetical protein
VFEIFKKSIPINDTVLTFISFFVKMELARELHKAAIKKFPTRKIVTQGIDHIWEADLLVMSKYSRQNGGFKYILNVIDCFSKYAWSVALKDKSGKEVSKGLETILRGKRKPKLLHVDRGKEFLNSTFKKLLQKYGIEMYHTFTEVKAAIVERFNRTINEKFKLHFEINQNHQWRTILPIILKEYNEKNVHRTIGTQPARVTRKNEDEIYERMYSLKNFKFPKPLFKVGDRVRITRKKDVFSNKYDRKWTMEIFLVSKIHYTVPPTYEIEALDGEEISGKFYKNELQKTKF